MNSESLKCTIKVFTIRVLDVNDNAPFLLSSSLVGTVSEAADVGTEIIKLHGNDLDLVSLNHT